MIRVALFDLDDTLLDHRGAVTRGLHAHREALGHPFTAADPDAEAARWHALEEEHYHRYLAGELDFEGQRRARARAFVETFGQTLEDAAASAWFDAYFARYRAAWELFDDALACLDAVAAAGIRIGIITNGDLAFQTRKLRSLGILERMEHVVASGALGVTKPDPGIFEHAVSLFGVGPAEALYVGDRLHTDAIGATEAGLRGVWLDRPGLGDAGAGAGADAGARSVDSAGIRAIRTLHELPQHLG